MLRKVFFFLSVVNTFALDLNKECLKESRIQLCEKFTPYENQHTCYEKIQPFFNKVSYQK